MKWLEIIELRAVHFDQNMLKQQIAFMMDEIKNEKTMKIFINVRVETDWRIHLQHESEKVEARGSALGLQLSQYLKEFGLVNHSVWIEKKISSKHNK